MNKKTTIVMTSLLLVGAALAFVPSVSAESGNAEEGDVWCLVENVGCYCTSSGAADCEGIASKECVASAGANPELMVGVVCKNVAGIKIPL
jgi:hypothetical protein